MKELDELLTQMDDLMNKVIEWTETFEKEKDHLSEKRLLQDRLEGYLIQMHHYFTRAYCEVQRLRLMDADPDIAKDLYEQLRKAGRYY